MSWIKSIGNAVSSATTSSVKVVSSIPPKSVSSVPSIKPSVPSIKPPDAVVPPKSGLGAGTVVGGVGIAGIGIGAGLLPQVFSSDGVVSQAIQAGAQVGTTAVIADQVAEIASELTSNPMSLLIVGVVVAGGLYMYFK